MHIFNLFLSSHGLGNKGLHGSGVGWQKSDYFLIEQDKDGK